MSVGKKKKILKNIKNHQKTESLRQRREKTRGCYFVEGCDYCHRPQSQFSEALDVRNGAEPLGCHLHLRPQGQVPTSVRLVPGMLTCLGNLAAQGARLMSWDQLKKYRCLERSWALLRAGSHPVCSYRQAGAAFQ